MRAVIAFAMINAAIIIGHCVAAAVILALGQAVIRGAGSDIWWLWTLVGLAGVSAGTASVIWLLETPKRRTPWSAPR